MMKHLTPELFKRRLQQITWPPIVIMSLAFLIVSMFVSYRQQTLRGNIIRDDLRATLRSQLDLLAQEVYLNRDEALDIRLKGILAAAEKKFPTADICLGLQPIESSVPLATNKICSGALNTNSGELETLINLNHEDVLEVRAGASLLANLRFGIKNHLTLFTLVPPSVILSLVLASFLSWAIYRILIGRLNSNVLEPLLGALKERERDTAISRTTQMLAHDVRKPFSLISASLEAIKASSDFKETRTLINQMGRDVQRSLRSVDSMLLDIMELGSSHKQLNTEDVSPVTLLNISLIEIFRLRNKSDIIVESSFDHTQMVTVDTVKVGRVISNIIDNATQAMNGKGKMWFKTRSSSSGDKDFVEFCIGNSGTYIPPEKRERIFDSFFTEGKRDGTGLGLAIAKKIVTLHGGRIWCEAQKEVGVEFFLTLPAAKQIDQNKDSQLPIHSSLVLKSDATIIETDETIFALDSDTESGEIELQLIRILQESNSEISILVVDDENAYRNTLKAQLTRSRQLADFLVISYAASAQETFNFLNRTTVDLAIVDIDLGANSETGIAVTQKIRSEMKSQFVCVHSNRISPNDHQSALTAGADWFLPKPMSRAHLLKILLTVVAAKAREAKPVVVEKSSSGINLDHIFVFDDDEIIHQCWKMMAKQQKIENISYFHSWEEFQSNQERRASTKSAVAFVDLNFEGSNFDGTFIAQELRTAGVRRIYAVTGSFDVAPEIAQHFDQVLEKTVPTNIRSYL